MTPASSSSSSSSSAGASSPASSDLPNCVICLEPITEDCLSLPCKHRYDYLCLLSWLQLRPECPLCKTPLLFIRVFDKATGKPVVHRVEQPNPPPRIPNPSNTENPISLRDRSSFRCRPRPRLPQPERVDEDTSVLQRRHIYRTGMRCLHVGSNRISRFRNFTPRMVRDDEELQSRAKMWIRRELRVFEWTNENSEFLLEYIMAVLKTVDIKSSSGAAEDMLTEFLGRESTKTFLHELHAFLRSPFTSLQSFDAFVQYEFPLPTRFDEDGCPLPDQNSRKRRSVPDSSSADSADDRRVRRGCSSGTIETG